VSRAGALRVGVGQADITPPCGLPHGLWRLRTGRASGVREPMLAQAVQLLGKVMDPDSTPVARVQLAHASCLLEHGKRTEAASVVEDARQAIATSGPAGAALQPTLRLLHEKLGPAATH